MSSESEKTGPEGTSGTENDDDRADYEVGYGKPPRSTRFQPGQSGNPKGRPKGSRNAGSGRSTARQRRSLVLDEGYREIPIREGGEVKTIPVVQAALRNLGVQAAQGKQGAANKLLDLVRSAQAEDKLERERLFEAFVEYKHNAQMAIDESRRKGLPEPEFLPHPEAIFVDPHSGAVITTGPWTKEEAKFLDAAYETRSAIAGALEEEEAKPDAERDEERIACSEDTYEELGQKLDRTRIVLQPREG